MERDDVINNYFEWLCSLVPCPRRRVTYRKLLYLLFDKEFTYTVLLDENRASDGVHMRYRFGDIADYHHSIIATYLDDKPCSMLEMLVSLALRCEENIMGDPKFGDRTGQWFWDMIESLGLTNEDDIHFDKQLANKKIDRFLNRDYELNGRGGLFTFDNPPLRLREKEIWWQMMHYLNEIIYERR